MATRKKVRGIPTIDVMLVVVRTDDLEIAVDTASKLGIEPQTDTTEAIKLVKLGTLLSQKPSSTTITGHTITLTDNVFTPELVQILQGGTIEEDTDGNITYTPPLAGSNEKGKVFELDAYSAVYDASGQIVNYEKTTYPNCQGTPITQSSEDNVFRVSEYTINSAPRTGQAPYKISYIKELPTFDEGTEGGNEPEVQEQSEDTAAYGRTYTTDSNMSGIMTMPEKSTDLSEI